MTDITKWNWQVGDYAYIKKGGGYLSTGAIVPVTEVGEHGRAYTGDAGNLADIAYWDREVLRCVRPGEVIPAGVMYGIVRGDGSLKENWLPNDNTHDARDLMTRVWLTPPTPQLTPEEQRKADLLKQIDTLKAEVAELERTVKA